MKQLLKYLGFIIGIVLINICSSNVKKEDCQIQKRAEVCIQHSTDSILVEEQLPKSKAHLLGSGSVLAIN